MNAPPEIVDAYYLDSHMATCVPRSIRRDMQWLVDHGTNAVSISILEDHLRSAASNVDIICEEAHRAGIRVFATLSRWGGLVAGAPRVPSTFAVEHPDLWALTSKGTPHAMPATGPIVSIHYPEVLDFFNAGVEALLRRWAIDGINWDEPKSMHLPDWSSAARERKPAGSDDQWYADAVADFFDAVSAHAKRVRPQTVVSMFLYAHFAVQHPYVVQRAARIRNVDYFGCDGRPWGSDDELSGDAGRRPSTPKLLLPAGAEFVRIARENGRRAFLLIENAFYGPDEAHYLDAMRRTLPQVLALRPEHLTYYYYGRNVADPERNMQILADALRGSYRAGA